MQILYSRTVKPSELPQKKLNTLNHIKSPYQVCKWVSVAMELVANYVDYNSQQSLSAVLRWCDTAGTVPLRDVADVAKRQKLLEQWTRYAVMRSIKLEMHLRGKEWETWSQCPIHVPFISIYSGEKLDDDIVFVSLSFFDMCFLYHIMIIIDHEVFNSYFRWRNLIRITSHY